MNSAAEGDDFVEPTSTMTIPNEYTSVSLVMPFLPSNTSGAVHRMGWSLRTGVVCSRLGLTVVSPKSVRRARAVSSTRMLSLEIGQRITITSLGFTYSFKVPMDHTNRVKVVQTLSDIE